MNRQPRLETFLRKLHIPEYMYIAPPAADRARRVRRQELQATTAKASGSLLTAQTVELAPAAASSLATPDPEKANPAGFDPAPIGPEVQN